MTITAELQERTKVMTFGEFDYSLTPQEYREITFYNGPTIYDFWEANHQVAKEMQP